MNNLLPSEETPTSADDHVVTENFRFLLLAVSRVVSPRSDVEVLLYVHTETLHGSGRTGTEGRPKNETPVRNVKLKTRKDNTKIRQADK